jgi:GTP pyrophosphokinase
MNQLDKALTFASEKHEGQTRDNGDPFVLHPIKVGQILITVTPDDDNLIAAGVLHDTLEDTDTTYDELVTNFNEDVASLVQEVTKSGYNTFPDLKTRRGVMLKFADRLANLSTIDEWSPEEQQRYLDKSKFWKS